VLIPNVFIEVAFSRDFLLLCSSHAAKQPVSLKASDVATSSQTAVFSSFLRHASWRCRFAGSAFFAEGFAPSCRLGPLGCRVITFFWEMWSALHVWVLDENVDHVPASFGIFTKSRREERQKE